MYKSYQVISSRMYIPTVIIQSFKVQIFSYKQHLFKRSFSGLLAAGLMGKDAESLWRNCGMLSQVQSWENQLEMSNRKEKNLALTRVDCNFYTLPWSWGLQDKFFVQFRGIHSVKAKAECCITLLIPGSLLTSGHLE